jgi:hypothetical protein
MLVACGDADSRPRRNATTRDSAGVAIVETHVGGDDGSNTWVAATPHLRIGTVAGDPRYELTTIAGVVRNERGDLIVADRGSYSLKIFDSSGVFVKEVSRRGEAPDELTQDILAMHRCGAETIVLSEWNARAGWWSLDGQFLGRARYVTPAESDPRSGRVFGGVSRPLYSACSPNGRIIMTSWGDPTREPSISDLKEQTAVSYPTWSKLWLVDTAGTVLTEMRDTIIAERIMHRSSSAGGGSGPHMFGRNIAFALDSSTLFVSYGDKPEIALYSFDGVLRGLWRAPPEDLSLTPDIIREYETRTLPTADSARRARYVGRFAITYPATFPAFDHILLARGGYLWARRYAMPGENVRRWGVFEPSGAFLGYTQFPSGLEVFEINDDYVVGVMRDSLDVPFVQLHRISLPGRSGQ